ncbi:MAG: hypothetical protein K2W82_11200 [Candidatus Obscuribacterales bacterium]|nr:hypothetical protein [Candidatus Obscuribacterales bacterium]
MSHNPWTFLKEAMEKTAESVVDGKAISAVLSIRGTTPRPYLIDVGVSRPANGQVFEVSISGTCCIRGALETQRGTDMTKLIDQVILPRLQTVMSHDPVEVQIVPTSADNSTYLPAFAGNSREGKLHTMSDARRAYMETAVTQAVDAVTSGNQNSAELHIRCGNNTQPLVVRIERQQTGGKTPQLLISLPPRHFVLSGASDTTDEVKAFLMGNLPVSIALENNVAVALKENDKAPIILTPEDVA